MSQNLGWLHVSHLPVLNFVLSRHVTGLGYESPDIVYAELEGRLGLSRSCSFG